MKISVKVQSLQFQVGLVGEFYYAFDIAGLDKLHVYCTTAVLPLSIFTEKRFKVSDLSFVL